LPSLLAFSAVIGLIAYFVSSALNSKYTHIKEYIVKWSTTREISSLEYNNVKNYGLFVDEKFNIKSTNPLNLKGIYHMVFSFITDISVLVELDKNGIEDTIKLLNKYGIMWYDSKTTVERNRWGYTVEIRSE